MPPVAAPADKRFRRAHVKPSSRRRSRLQGIWIAARVVIPALLSVYGAWRAAVWITGTPAFHVAQITVSGNERLSTGEVLSLVDGLQGLNILGLDLAAWQDRLLGSPWVEAATLRCCHRERGRAVACTIVHGSGLATSVTAHSVPTKRAKLRRVQWFTWPGVLPSWRR